MYSAGIGFATFVMPAQGKLQPFHSIVELEACFVAVVDVDDKS